MPRVLLLLSVSLVVILTTPVQAQTQAIFHDGFENGDSCRWSVLRVTYPARGATVLGSFSDPTVQVTGSVGNPACLITNLTLNDSVVPISPSDTFTQGVTADPGANVLVFEAGNGQGTQDRRVQAFLWSDGYHRPDPLVPESGMVDPGLADWLSQGVIDDGDHSQPPDDLATIIEMAVNGIDLMDFITNPVYTYVGGLLGTVEVSVTSLSHSGAIVGLTAVSGGLDVAISLQSISGGLFFDCTTGFPTLCSAAGDSAGSLTMTALTYTATVALGVDAEHNLTATVTTSSTVATGLDVSADDAFYDAILDTLGSQIDAIISALGDYLDTAVVELVVAAAGSSASDFTLEVPRLDGSPGVISSNVTSDFSSVDFDTPGGALFLRKGAYAASVATPYSNLGVPDRAACGTGPQMLVLPAAAPMERSVADDALNQQLYATWLGGWLETPVPNTLLDLTGHPATDAQVAISGRLAPTASDCNDSSHWESTLGELEVRLSLQYDGAPADVVAHAALTHDLAFSTPSTGLLMELGAAQAFELEVDIAQEAAEQHRTALVSILEDFLQNGLTTAMQAQPIARLPLLSVDVSEAVGQPPGTLVIEMVPSAVGRVDGNVIVSGDLQ
jgi:hypothetical protein